LGKERAEKANEFTCQGGKSEASAKVEELAYGEKITKALTSCEACLEKSVVAVKSAREESDNWVWHAAAELEYALFLFSLKNADENVTLKRKTGSRDKNDSTAKLLNTVQNLVVQSKESIATGNWLQAHKYAYAAGNILLRIQREYGRKKRGSSGK
jgi:sugar diacid utilization regulator